MKKHVLLGVSMIVGAYASVATTAFALFLPQARLNGLQFSVAHKALLLSIDGDSPVNFSSTIEFPALSELEPGGSYDQFEFWVKNGSSSGNPLSLWGKFSAGDADWEFLKSIILINVQDVATGNQVGWKSLAEWEQSQHQFPNSTLGLGSKRRYRLQYSLAEAYSLDPDGSGPLTNDSLVGSEVMGKATTNLVFTLDGRESDI